MHARPTQSILARVRAWRFIVPAILATLFLTGCSTTDHFITNCGVDLSARGRQYVANGQCIQAEESCQLALEYQRSDADALHCLGLVAMSCHHDLQSAERYLRHSLVIEREVAATHNNLGVVLLRRQPPQLAQACALFERATELDPDDVIAHDHAITCLAALTGELARGGDEAGAARAERRREAAVEARRTLELTRSATTRAPARRARARAGHAR